MNPGLCLEVFKNYLSFVLLDVSLASQNVVLAISVMTNTVGLDGLKVDLFIPAYATRITLKMESIFCRTIPRIIL